LEAWRKAIAQLEAGAQELNLRGNAAGTLKR
jgi:hypothetical protein